MIPFRTRNIERFRAGPALAAALFLAQCVPPAATIRELPRAAPEDAGFVPGRLDRVTACMHQYVADGSLPGAVTVVLRDGAVVYEEAVGYGDLEGGTRLEVDAIFRIASQTKAIVSVAVMMLQEDGALLISDPLAKYLPAFTETTVAVADGEGGYDIVPAGRPITIRDLLTHTAGIGYGYGGDLWREAGITGWYFAHRDEPVRATVDRMAALPFQAQPGTSFVYGYATDILGALVEEVSGLTLDDFLATASSDPSACATPTSTCLPARQIAWLRCTATTPRANWFVLWTVPEWTRKDSAWTVHEPASPAAPVSSPPPATTPASSR